MMDAWRQDLRYAVRSLLRTPGFTLVAVLTLAVGIGANAIIFSVVNGLLLRPLPVARPERLVALFAADRHSGSTRPLSYPEYLDYRDHSGVFADLVAQQGAPVSLRIGDGAEVVWSELVTPNYFSVLGLATAPGTGFPPDLTAGAGAVPLVVLSHRLWLSRFGGARDVVGTAVSLNGHSFTIAGVAPPRFTGLRRFGFLPDLWVPIGMHPQIIPASDGLLQERESRWLHAIGRLRPGLTLEAASSAASAFAGGLAEENPGTPREQGARLVPAESGFEDPTYVPPRVLVLSAALAMGGVGLVLLLACANVANLLLARASTRQREIALRRALGAGPGRLLRQFLTESLLLALAGAAAGVALASQTGRIQSLVVPRLQFPVGFDPSLDHRVLLFTLVVSLAAAVVFGLAPGLHVSRPDLAGMLKDGTARARGRRADLRSLLVVAQVALSLVLLVGGGLFLKSLLQARKIDAGLAREHRLLLSINPALQGYEEARGRELHRRLARELQALPGVISSTLSFPLPLDTYGRSRTVFLDDGAAADARGASVGTSVVATEYFATVGTPLVRGRDFGPQDTAGAERVAIVNQSMARRFWGAGDPVGRRFRLGSPDGPVVRVAGVARDGKYGTIGEAARPYLYLPLEQDYRSGVTVVVHTRGDPGGYLPAVREAIRRLDPDLGTFGVMTMDQHLENALNLPKISALFAGAFAGVALLLAVVGIYGVVSYSVARRTREVGIRMALGARAGDVVGLVLRGGAVLAAAGIAAGLALAIPAGRLLGTMLYDVSPGDLSVYLLIPLILGAAVLLASYVPARRASRVDPLISLRAE